jgi:hypothetical protein
MGSLTGSVLGKISGDSRMRCGIGDVTHSTGGNTALELVTESLQAAEVSPVTQTTWQRIALHAITHSSMSHSFSGFRPRKWYDPCRLPTQGARMSAPVLSVQHGHSWRRRRRRGRGGGELIVTPLTLS